MTRTCSDCPWWNYEECHNEFSENWMEYRGDGWSACSHIDDKSNIIPDDIEPIDDNYLNVYPYIED